MRHPVGAGGKATALGEKAREVRRVVEAQVVGSLGDREVRVEHEPLGLEQAAIPHEEHVVKAALATLEGAM